MNVSITIKSKLNVDKEDIPKLVEVCEQYRLACNFVSEWIFNNELELNSVNISNNLYHSLRGQFNLKSQFASSVPKTVTARYKTVQDQLRKNPYKYQDDSGKWKYISKTLEWLHKPVYFKRPQADLVRNRDYSFLEEGKILSINTLQGRIKCTFETKGFEQYFKSDFKLGTAKLVESKGNWFLHISATKEVEEFDKTETTNVIGIDRGIRQLMTTYDTKGKTEFYSGKTVAQKRNHYKDLRTSLQKRNTKSSKRRIRKLESRENRWMNDVNHCLSRTLVDKVGANAVLVIEDLSSVREVTTKVNKDNRYEQVSWSYHQLEQFLTYKANLVGSKVVKVSAEYTSQRCIKCGTIDKNQRKKEIHEYQCQCGYKSNDDRIAAMNIQLLGTLWVSGTEEPKYTK